jgi:TonB-like protein
VIKRICVLLCSIVAACTAAAGQTDPALTAVSLPKYPLLALQARVEGVVKVSFTLPANSGEPADVEAVSGHMMLKGAAVENVKTWRLENPYAVARKYETTFVYKLSGLEVPLPKRCTVTFDSYHQVDLVSDVAAPTINY